MLALRAAASAVRHLPSRIADPITARLLLPNQQHHALTKYFADAPLAHAPGVRMTLSPTDFMHGYIAFTGAYERDLSGKILELARGGGTFIDVGANWGYFSLLWSAANPANTAYALEASPRNIQPLQVNIDRNGSSDRIKTYFVAAGSIDGSMSFDLGPEGVFGWGGLSRDASESTVDVPVRRLDDVCIDVPAHSVLKIDVEGAEALVLEGAKTLLRERRLKRIFPELNDARMKKLGIPHNEPRLILEANGYVVAENDGAIEAWPRHTGP